MTDVEPLLGCIRCGQTKPSSAFRNPHDAETAVCRACVEAARIQTYGNNAQKQAGIWKTDGQPKQRELPPFDMDRAYERWHAMMKRIYQ